MGSLELIGIVKWGAGLVGMAAFYAVLDAYGAKLIVKYSSKYAIPLFIRQVKKVNDAIELAKRDNSKASKTVKAFEGQLIDVFKQSIEILEK